MSPNSRSLTEGCRGRHRRPTTGHGLGRLREFPSRTCRPSPESPGVKERLHDGPSCFRPPLVGELATSTLIDDLHEPRVQRQVRSQALQNLHDLLGGLLKSADLETLVIETINPTFRTSEL